MAWIPKVWVDRAVQFAGRRLLTPVAGVANTVDVTRAEGTVFTVGDRPDAASLNNLEGRIGDAFDNIEDYLGWIDITADTTWSSSLLTSYTYYAKVNPKIRMIEVTCVLFPGRANNTALFTLPAAYKPALTKNMGIGYGFDKVANFTIQYYMNTTGALIGAHTIGAPTGDAEFIHFNFTY